MRLTYEPKDIKESFPVLKSQNDYVLIPLFDAIFHSWIRQLKLDDVVTDTRNIDSRRYDFVVNGKIVSLAISETDIDYDDEDESWYNISGLDFNGNEQEGRTLIERLKSFVGSQDLGTLVRSAGASLKTGKTYHLRNDVEMFYFASEFAKEKAAK